MVSRPVILKNTDELAIFTYTQTDLPRKLLQLYSWALKNEPKNIKDFNYKIFSKDGNK